MFAHYLGNNVRAAFSAAEPNVLGGARVAPVPFVPGSPPWDIEALMGKSENIEK